jgi:hypothetical protein
LLPEGGTAKSLAAFLKIPKSEVNKALYRLLSAGGVVKRETEGAPSWTAANGTPPIGSAPIETPIDPTLGVPSAPVVSRVVPDASNTTAGVSSEDASLAGSPVEGQICCLTRSKRVAVTSYRGKKTLTLREFYEKRGAWLPGKKGITLSLEQFRALKNCVADVNAKLGNGETRLSAPDATFAAVVANLSETRRVTVGTFRGAATVGVREYYEKNGEMLPGLKGLNMSADQWRVFCAHVERIETAMTS